MDFDFSTDSIIPDASDTLTITASGSLTLPIGTNAQRPVSPVAGMLRFNTQLVGLEVFNGTSWLTLGVGVGGTVTSVATSAPPAGITISGSPITTAGTLTFALANDLAAVEGLTTTGFAVRTATDAWTTRSIAGVLNRISVLNGAGTAANPTIDIATTYAGQSSINTVGTITSGTWNASLIQPQFGGTGLSTIGTPNQILGVAASGLVLEYKNIIASSFSINVGPGGSLPWTLLTGSLFYADILHNLGTQDIVVQLSDIANNQMVFADNIVFTNASTTRVVVRGNTRTLRVVIIANGTAIVAGGSTPSSILVRDEGTLVSTTGFTSLNFVGDNVTATNEGAGVARITVGGSNVIRTLTWFAVSLDSPNNTNWIINALAPTVADPSNPAINVRRFSNTIEQGVGLIVPFPSAATNARIILRGRAEIAPGTPANVQMRIYSRELVTNGPVAPWSAPFELNNIAIPTNSFFQYFVQTIPISSFTLTSEALLQFEITRRVVGVSGTNLPANFLLNEISIEFF